MSDTTLDGAAGTSVGPGSSPAAAERGPAPARGDRVRHVLARMPPWSGAAVALAVTVLIVSVDAPAIFLTWDNISSILGGLAEPLILTAAMTLLLTFGIVDLSIAAVMTLGGIFMLGMINLGLPGWLVLPATMGLVGLWVVVTVGFLIAVQRINYFIVTIGMLGVAGAFATIFTHGQAVSLFGKHRSWTSSATATSSGCRWASCSRSPPHWPARASCGTRRSGGRCSPSAATARRPGWPASRSTA